MFYGLAGVASLALSLFFWWSYSGPYRLIADLQSWLWGVNVINISLILSWAALYTPLHILVARVERRFGVKREPLGWKRLVALFNFFFEQRPGQVAGIGLIIFCVGGWFWGNSATTGPLTTLSVAEAERGTRPQSRYVRLTDAKILTESELSYKRNSSIEHYYPVTSKQGDASQIRVFVRLDGSDATSPPEEIIGELEFDGLPGPLRVHVADKGLLAPDYFVVRHRRDPASESSFAAKMAAVGAVVFAAGLLWARARGKRAAPASSS
jgi:hypothetical protein